jgi:short-subunit dehydrogenase
MRVENKVVLITGASEGIGAACAGVFRERGARLCLTARSAEKLRSAAGPRDLVIPADLLDIGATERIVAETVARFGRLDVLINNAGAGLYTPAHNSPPELARRLFELNFFAPLELIRHAVPHMRRQGGGAIVNISSIAGAVSLPWFTLYSASKSAMIALTDGLRIELRRDSIHCMSVCPGYVRTNFQRNILAGEVPQALGPMRQRWAITAEECAKAIADGLERNSRTVVTPRTGWLLIALARLFPRLVDRRLESALRDQNLKESSPQA